MEKVYSRGIEDAVTVETQSVLAAVGGQWRSETGLRSWL